MIILNQISKDVGRAQFRRTILAGINWLIPPRTRVVILGHPYSGAASLLDIIAGTTLPTSGWVERRATVSPPTGLLRYAMLDTTRQLVLRLSRIYRVAPDEVNRFIMEGFGGRNVLDVPARSLPQRMKQQLNVVLTYAFPQDFYLFNNNPTGVGEPEIQAFCEKALELRSKQAGIIIRSTSGRAARRLDTTMMGAVLYRGNLTLYKQLTDAIVVFESLPPEEASGPANDLSDEHTVQVEDEDLLI